MNRNLSTVHIANLKPGASVEIPIAVSSSLGVTLRTCERLGIRVETVMNTTEKIGFRTYRNLYLILADGMQLAEFRVEYKIGIMSAFSRLFTGN